MLLIPTVEAVADISSPDSLVSADAGRGKSRSSAARVTIRATRRWNGSSGASTCQKAGVATEKALGPVEPAFADIRCNKGQDRFTLHGRKKVDAQWKLLCLVHKIAKLARNGYGA